MREQMLDILERLSSLNDAFGREAFDRACHRARLAIARVALEEAERSRPPARTKLTNAD